MNDPVILHPASYRDPSGFIFIKNGALYRQVNLIYKEQFDYFVSSGCFEQLVKKKLLISHEVIKENFTGLNTWYQTLKPDLIEFISYPYEWSFTMLKDAALLTLQIMKEIIPNGMILKDASPLNVQWHQGKFIFIDTLSFEKFDEKPWIAYRQFCESFLSPLLLMHYAKTPLQRLLLAYPEGIPLEVTRSLLPRKSKFSLHTYLHIHLHSKVSMNNAGRKQEHVKFSKQKLLNLISSLESLIKKLKLPKKQNTWSSYYTEASQRENYLSEKRKILENWIKNLKGVRTALDLGCNNGEFSKLFSSQGIHTVSADFDPYCIDDLYLNIKQNAIENIQPLVIDLSDPSPSAGINNQERISFLKRSKPDLILALAVIHHLAIGKNIPFSKIVSLLGTMLDKPGSKLIIEFVPKEDEKALAMLQNRKDIFDNYTEKEFLSCFEKCFKISEKQKINPTGRTLYLMEKK